MFVPDPDPATSIGQLDVWEVQRSPRDSHEYVEDFLTRFRFRTFRVNTFRLAFKVRADDLHPFKNRLNPLSGRAGRLITAGIQFPQRY